MKTKKIKLKELTTIKMVSGNEKKYKTVIINNYVEDWVGFGWVTVRRATKKDYKKIPVAVN